MKNSLISKIISVGTALQIGMFGGFNACAGNLLSLHTTTKEPATKAVKLEPDLLACVFVNMPFHYDEIRRRREEFQTLRTLPLISKNAAEAMKMIKIFDFRKFDTLEKGNYYCARLANLVSKIYPNIQTINCTFYQMYAFDDEKLNIFENLIKDKVKIINISIGSESTVKGLPRGFKEGKMKHSYKGIKINTELVRECDVRPISPQKAEALVVKDINDFNRFEDRDSLNESRILYVYSLGNNDEDQVLKILKEVTNHSKHKLFCFGVTSDEFFYYCMNRTSYEHSVEEMTCEMKGYSSKHGYKSYMQIVWKSSQEE